jgi:hypothetical protein
LAAPNQHLNAPRSLHARARAHLGTGSGWPAPEFCTADQCAGASG